MFKASKHYRDRREAGRVLGKALKHHADRDDLLVLALPRGGVPVGYEVAKALNAALDLLIVRKLGYPGHEELAMGAIATGGGQYLHEEVIERGGVERDQIDQVIEQERAEMRRREQAYRGDRAEAQVSGRPVVLVDDGLATGSTMMAAARAIRPQEPERIIIAVPVAPPHTLEAFDDIADETVCPLTPAGFRAVGQFYEQFEQTTDEEVRDLLAKSWEHEPSA
jgi:predicted phosphoribosyltransferase